jgi:hypothetical protein
MPDLLVNNQPVIALTDTTINGISATQTIFFSAAEPEETIQQRRERKRRERRERQAQKTAALVRQPVIGAATSEKVVDESAYEMSCNNGLQSSTIASPVTSAIQTTHHRDEADAEDFIQTWMVCLADAIRNLTSLGRK